MLNIENIEYMAERCPVNIALMSYRLKNFEEAIEALKMNQKLLETITTENASSLYGNSLSKQLYRGHHQRSSSKCLFHPSFML
jgi:hypothetical protein